MSYTLVIGNKNYSSWSMRAWLLLKFVGAEFAEQNINLYRADSRAKVTSLGGETGLVPVLIDGETVIWDTMAITEYLYETHPQIWPRDRKDRARARSLCGEVHSGFSALRNAMPVNARGRNRIAERSPAVLSDIARAQTIWSRTGERSDGPWLFGAFCAADIIFAPVALRFQTYDVALTGQAQTYFNTLLAHPLVQEWQALGKAESDVIAQFELPTR